MKGVSPYRSLVLLPIASLVGCQNADRATTQPATQPVMAATNNAADSEDTQAPLVLGGGTVTGVQTHTQANDAPATTYGYVVNGMVGQVNGKAIYADTVLEPLHEQLAAFGRQLPPGEFQRSAYDAIYKRLRTMVVDALFYGEARRDLNEREQAALKFALEKQREELLRLYGRGSVALAEQTLQRKKGKSLEQVLEDYRQVIVFQKLFYEEISPRINVTKHDIERYYKEHYARFNPPMTRVIRVIKVSDAERAGEVRACLRQGKSFERVASDPPNTWKRDQGGLMDAATGDDVFRQPELNEAMLGLGAGEHTDAPIEIDDAFWFLCVEDLQRPEGKPLATVQLDIERALVDHQKKLLTDHYIRDLFEKGNFTPVDQMAASLVRIAVNRYSPQPVKSAAVRP